MTDPDTGDADATVETETETDAPDGSVRLWLVERSYNDRNLIILIYATPDGERSLRKEMAATVIDRMSVTAAVDVDPAELDEVEDGETRERYAEEAARTAERYDPDEEI